MLGQQLSYEWQECSLRIPMYTYTSQLEMILVAFKTRQSRSYSSKNTILFVLCEIQS